MRVPACRFRRWLPGLLLGGWVGAAAALEDSASDFGGIGLMQTPTARFAPDGELRAGISSMSPYNQLLLGLQLLPWLETGLRYTEVTNRLYSPDPGFSGDQSYKDRGVDFKLRLLKEGEFWPAVALGVSDVGGTGLFASEYLVASRRYYDWDFSLGLGWGRLGARGGIRNPFAALSSNFEQREGSDIGELGTKRFFRGPEVALFGGVQWQTPLRHLSLKLEYEGNDYESEALDNRQKVDSPVNAAFNYRLWNSLDLSAGWERGNTFMFRIVAFTNFMTHHGTPKVLDPPPTPAYAVQAAREGRPLEPAADTGADFAERLRAELKRQDITMQAMSAEPSSGRITVWFTQILTIDQHRVLGRLGQTLATLAPREYSAFTLCNVALGAETYRVTLFRKQIEDAIEHRGSAEEIATSALIEPPRVPAYSGADYLQLPDYPALSWGMGPAVRQHIGGPDEFYIAQLWWRTDATVSFTPNWSVSGTVGIDIVNNFDNLNNRDLSVLPHVRSDIAQYLKEGQNNLVRLETQYAWRFAPSWYARASAGLFEEMYGGVAGEVLYRQAYAPWAVGVNLNWVRQRDFDQRFDFRDYEVATGHLTGYFDLPFYDLHANLSVGRYLAEDVGATLELSRRFASGVAVGAFATKTDVSAEEFGEGSFDKGFFIYLPLDLFFPRSSRKSATFSFRPLTRDGGQKVRDGASLFYLTEGGRFDPDRAWSSALR